MATRSHVTKVQRVEIGADPLARTAPPRRRAPILAAILLAAVAASAVLFSTGPSAEELERAHWQAVVDYHRELYRTTAGVGASEAAYWQQVVDYYESQWAPR
jgi:hypothetical protein